MLCKLTAGAVRGARTRLHSTVYLTMLFVSVRCEGSVCVQLSYIEFSKTKYTVHTLYTDGINSFQRFYDRKVAAVQIY